MLMRRFFSPSVLSSETEATSDSCLTLSKLVKPLAAILVVITIVVVFSSLHVSASSSSVLQISSQLPSAAAWITGYWTPNDWGTVSFMVANVGTQPVTVCYDDWVGAYALLQNGSDSNWIKNGVLVSSGCTSNPVPPHGNAFWRLSQLKIGTAGTIIVYDGSLIPIVPTYGQEYVGVYGQTNTNFQTAVPLVWNPTYPPSSLNGI
jgi:hypothetical protein